ncbi:MAG: hypothetical protein JNK10_11950 [Cyclobacteriaceae bacterium]|nr:hypothetical protein [Cyclobacteriaceae bacterium]
MNRKLITILGAQTLMIGALWAYGYVQQNAAARDADEANRQKQISKQLQFEKQVLERELKNCR